MLVVVMHNNQEYLESLKGIAKSEGINDMAVVKQKKIGTQLIGGQGDIILSKGQSIDAYNKAFVAMVPGEGKTKNFLDAIDENNYLNMLNLQDKGFICTVPFKQIADFTLESLHFKRKEIEKMRIVDLLIKNRMVLELKAKTKTEAINELANLVKDAEEVLNWSQFVKDVFEREALSTTGIGNEVAIPHARTDAVSDFFIVFGKSQAGIEFKSTDGKPVKLVFLMGTPKGKGVNSYLKILAKLSRFLGKKDFRDALMKTYTPEDVISEFKKVSA